MNGSYATQLGNEEERKRLRQNCRDERFSSGSGRIEIMKAIYHPCTLDSDCEAYVSFLLRHHDELQLPYSFAMKLSFISSPLMFGKGMLVYDERLETIVGAAGFVYGTGAHDYQNREICQVEIAFLRKEYRKTGLFARSLSALIQLIQADVPEVRMVQFWADCRQAEPKRLFDKFLELPGSTSEQMENGLVLYRIPLQVLEVYSRRFSRN